MDSKKGLCFLFSLLRLDSGYHQPAIGSVTFGPDRCLINGTISTDPHEEMSVLCLGQLIEKTMQSGLIRSHFLPAKKPFREVASTCSTDTHGLRTGHTLPSYARSNLVFYHFKTCMKIAPRGLSFRFDGRIPLFYGHAKLSGAEVGSIDAAIFARIVPNKRVARFHSTWAPSILALAPVVSKWMSPPAPDFGT